MKILSARRLPCLVKRNRFRERHALLHAGAAVVSQLEAIHRIAAKEKLDEWHHRTWIDCC